MENETDKKAEKTGARTRVALWKAALREGPGETPGPAGRALLADLRKLWLAREEEQAQAMREPPFPLPVDLAVRPLDALWTWWPEGRGGDDGPDEIALGHWRGLHDAALRARERLDRIGLDPVSCDRPDLRTLYPAGLQMAGTLLPALFHATAQGDAHAFALAFETLLVEPPGAFVGEDESIAWCGSPAFARFPEPWSSREESFSSAHECALKALFHLGLRAEIADAAWRIACLFWNEDRRFAETFGFAPGPRSPHCLNGLVLRAADAGCPEAIPAAVSLRDSIADASFQFLSAEERLHRRTLRSWRAWMFVGPLLHRGSRRATIENAWTEEKDVAARARSGEPYALASLGRAALGGDWRGDAFGLWRPAPPSAEDAAAAEAVFREQAVTGDATGCFYLGQIAWKRAFDRFKAARRRNGNGTETRLRFLDRDRRFLELPSGEADRWFRLGATLGGPGARECERTLAWRAAGRNAAATLSSLR